MMQKVISQIRALEIGRRLQKILQDYYLGCCSIDDDGDNNLSLHFPLCVYCSSYISEDIWLKSKCNEKQASHALF